MEAKVNFDGLMELLIQLNDAIYWEREAIRNDCGSISIRLNEIGFQGLATSSIDTAFSYMHNYFGRAHDYVAELVNWVNVNVMKEYQSADQMINTRFKEALNGFSTSLGESYGGYGANATEGKFNSDVKFSEGWHQQMQEYGRYNDDVIIDPSFKS